MAVPKKRLTKTRQGNRRAHQALKTMPIFRCPNCFEPIIAHHICKNCGQYKGKQILDLEKGKEKIKTKVK